MARKPPFLILCGDGINCERETARAFALAGAEPRVVHVNDLLANPGMLSGFEGLAVPGGFSFGDELGSGQILALKMRYGLADAFFDFVASKKPIIGICNGFQVLVRLGLLPFSRTLERAIALAPNEQGGFLDRWVTMEVDPGSVCVWTKGLKRLELPARHGEGRIVFKEPALFDVLKTKGQIPLIYTEDVNGSHGRIAGLCDEAGLILGLMPHPEAHVNRATYRAPSADFMAEGDGMALFKNIVRVLEGRERQSETEEAGASV